MVGLLLAHLLATSGAAVHPGKTHCKQSACCRHSSAGASLLCCGTQRHEGGGTPAARRPWQPTCWHTPLASAWRLRCREGVLPSSPWYQHHLPHCLNVQQGEACCPQAVVDLLPAHPLVMRMAAVLPGEGALWALVRYVCSRPAAPFWCAPQPVCTHQTALVSAGTAGLGDKMQAGRRLQGCRHGCPGGFESGWCLLTPPFSVACKLLQLHTAARSQLTILFDSRGGRPGGRDAGRGSPAGYGRGSPGGYGGSGSSASRPAQQSEKAAWTMLIQELKKKCACNLCMPRPPCTGQLLQASAAKEDAWTRLQKLEKTYTHTGCMHGYAWAPVLLRVMLQASAAEQQGSLRQARLQEQQKIERTVCSFCASSAPMHDVPAASCQPAAALSWLTVDQYACLHSHSECLHSLVFRDTLPCLGFCFSKSAWTSWRKLCAACPSSPRRRRAPHCTHSPRLDSICKADLILCVQGHAALPELLLLQKASGPVCSMSLISPQEAGASMHFLHHAFVTFMALNLSCVPRDMLPCLGFCFSKKRVDQLAQALRSMSLISSQEAGASMHFFDHALSRLHPDDRNLPQALRIRDLLGRGLGVHHAGEHKSL